MDEPQRVPSDKGTGTTLPSDLRFLLAVKFPGKCAKCSSHLSAGSPAWWTQRQKKVFCTKCVDTPHSYNQSAPDTSAGRGPVADVAQQQWGSLVDYLIDCVTRESSEGALTNENRGTRWRAVPRHYLDLLENPTATVPVPASDASFAEGLRAQEVLTLGWPYLLRAREDGGEQIVPIMVLPVEVSGVGDTLRLRTVEPPYVNPEIFNPGLLDAYLAEQLSDIIDQAIALEHLDPRTLLDKIRDLLDGVDYPEIEVSPIPGTLNLLDDTILFKAEESGFTRALLIELRQLKDVNDWQGTAASLLIRAAPEIPSRPLGLSISPFPLNDSQEQALKHIRSDRLTVVTGPPGTGKSQLVAAAVANAWLDGESVLIGSTNNTAVNVACERANSIAEAALIRTGNATYREHLPEIVNSALSHLETGDTQTDRLREASARADATVAARTREAYFVLLERRRDVEAKLNQRVPFKVRCEKQIWSSHPPTDELQTMLSWHTVKAAKAKLFRKWRRARVVNRAGIADASNFPFLFDWAQAHKEVAALMASLDDLQLSPEEDEKTIAQLEQAWLLASKEAILATYTATMRRGAEGLRSLGITRQGGGGLAATIAGAKNTAKGWACSALTMRSNFPLVAGLFDLVIVDEASQCSLAHVLPLAYRATRLAVIGDLQQLAPIVKLTPREVTRIAIKNGLKPESLQAEGLDFSMGSAYSAFEVVAGFDKVSLLSEHYRCHPLIARWFNAAFYRGSLTVLTDLVGFSSSDRALIWTDVEGSAVRSNGRSWMNEAEAQSILKEIEEILIEDRSASVGVVTPFSAQSTLLEQMVRDRFNKEAISELDLVIGTAHRFQGNERDIMLFSTVLTPGVTFRAIKWVEDSRNLINVAASRAKSSLRIFGHPSIGKPSVLRLPTLEGLRAAALEGLEDNGASWRIHSGAEQLLYEAMVKVGLAPITKPIESGYELDFALITPTLRLNIEVDGLHHFDERGRQRRQDLARDRVLRSLNWEVLRIPDWCCYIEADSIAEKIRVRTSNPLI